MGKISGTEPWKRFKRSISQLSLSGKLALDLAQSNARRNTRSQDLTSDSDSDSASDFNESSSCDDDCAITPLFLPPTTMDLDLNFHAWIDSDPQSLALVCPSNTTGIPPPRLNKRQSVGSLPPRRHPYPSNFTHSIKTYNTVANPLGLRKVFFSLNQGKRLLVVYRKKITETLFNSKQKNRGFKGFSTKLRRCFSFPALRLKKEERVESDVELDDTHASLGCSTSEENSSDESTVIESLYSRIMRAAKGMDLDESTVGSLIMIVGEEEPEPPTK